MPPLPTTRRPVSAPSMWRMEGDEGDNCERLDDTVCHMWEKVVLCS